MQFSIKWHTSQPQLPTEELATFAELSLLANNTSLFRHEDLLEKRFIQEGINVSSYPLALWFAVNWWRLRWEAALPANTTAMQKLDWEMSHSLGAVGQGYYWPDITFTSDTQSIYLQHQLHQDNLGGIRYLEAYSGKITAHQFEEAVFKLIEQTLEQLNSKGINKTDLHQAWADLKEDLAQTSNFRYRQLEAQLGFDQNESEPNYLSQLLEAENQLGHLAVNEIAQAEKNKTLEVLEEVKNQLTQSKSLINFENTKINSTSSDQNLQPWEAGQKAAQQLRNAWGIASDYLSNEQLAERLSASKKLWQELSTNEVSIAAAQTDANKTAKLMLGKSRPLAQRFMLARIIGDYLYTTNTQAKTASAETLVCTIGKTYRQKYQRAFAQELLCPYTALIERLDTLEPDDEAISEAAEHFLVSPLVVNTVLVNKGHLPNTLLDANQ
ncbi:hypothetical protein [Marinospirillum insulare]|uniref:Uncharacterized protein n=1 Tax=Marinospirillum insulare TaxID=217169 RepID=A0ABQ6A3L6_9GAMM|nr:hypothetical protein [Marinospirillum insulare]GLR64685.1 hypothetical protein GCM10007878_21230 [Marinospirillum insulare]